MTRALITAALLVLVVVSGVRAQDQSSEASLHFQLGQQLVQQHDLDGALEHFLASYRLVANPNVAFNVAEVYRQLARRARDRDAQRQAWSGAFNWYETVLVEHQVDDDVRQLATGRRTEAAAHVAVVDVRTTPPGATLFVDHERLGAVGVSPRSVAVSPGQHRILARAEGYRDGDGEVEAQEGASTSLEIVLTARVGTLVVESEPPGATVRAAGRDEDLGQTPLTVQVPVGPMHLAITAPGRARIERPVTIRDGETSRVRVELERIAAEVAVLTVTGRPAGAAVELNGQEIGTLPVSRDDLPPGNGRIVVRSPGREEWSSDLLLEAGGATRVEVDLATPPSVPRSTWRWIGYGGAGALLLFGGLTAVLARTARSDFLGSDNPTRAMLDRVDRRNLAADILMAAGLVGGGVTLVLDLVIDVPASSGAVRIER